MQKIEIFLERILDILIDFPMVNKNKLLTKFFLGMFRKYKNIYHIFTDTYSRADNLKVAEKILRFGMFQNVEKKEITWKLILVLFQRGKYNNAILLLTDLLNLKNISEIDIAWYSNIHGLLAKAYLYTGSFELSKKHINESQKIADWDLDACSTQIELFTYTGEKNKVLPLLSDYIEKYPNIYPPYVWLADYYCLVDDFSSGEMWYEEALMKADDDVSREFCDKYYSTRGMVGVCISNYLDLLLKSGKTEKASLLLERYSKLSYKDQLIYNERLADYHIYRKEFLQAEALLKELISKNRGEHEYLAYLSKVYILMSESKKSEVYLNKALALNNDSFGVIDIASEIYLATGDYLAAKEAVEKLLNKFPFDTIYRKRLLECEEKLSLSMGLDLR